MSGRVQGVGFRWFAVEEGTRLGLRGWVRNRRDGRVEALGEGSPAQLDAFEAWLQAGPPTARVADLQREDEPAGGEPLGPFGREATV